MYSKTTIVKSVLIVTLITSALSLIVTVASGYLHLAPIFATTTTPAVEGVLADDYTTTTDTFVELLNELARQDIDAPSDVLPNTTTTELTLIATSSNQTLATAALTTNITSDQ